MLHRRPFGVGKIGKRAGDSQDAMVGTCRQPHSLHRELQHRASTIVGNAVSGDVSEAEAPIAYTLALQLNVTRVPNQLRSRMTVFAHTLQLGQLTSRDSRDLQLQIQPIEQGA